MAMRPRLRNTLGCLLYFRVKTDGVGVIEDANEPLSEIENLEAV